MTEPVLLAGFDAGQTHTTCRLALRRSDGSLQVLAEGDGPGVSHLAAAAGEERFTAALTISLERARTAATHSSEGLALTTSLQAAVVGASGIEQGSAVQQLGTALAAAALGLPLQRVLVSGDERTALHGAFGGRPGIVVISGTGCIALGRNAQGEEHRCGGWGWLLDRSGSACDIGRDALSLSLEMADGRHPDTGLRATLWNALKLDPADPQAGQRIKALVVTPAFGAAGFARLAPLIDRHAMGGDTDAEAILARSVAALVAMVGASARKLQLTTPDVCAVGGAFEHLTRLRELFKARLELEWPSSRLQAPQGDACQGALSLASGLLSGGL